MKNKIKEFCDGRGMTPYRFYKNVGLAPKTGYDLYNNPCQLPSSTVLSKICDFFCVQPNDILEWVPSRAETGEDVSE